MRARRPEDPRVAGVRPQRRRLLQLHGPRGAGAGARLVVRAAGRFSLFRRTRLAAAPPPRTPGRPAPPGRRDAYPRRGVAANRPRGLFKVETAASPRCVSPRTIQVETAASPRSVSPRTAHVVGRARRSYLEGRSSDGGNTNRHLLFDVGGLGGLLAAGKTGLEVVASHALEHQGAVFFFVASHVGVDAEGVVGQILHDVQEKPTPCSYAAMKAWDWAVKRKAANAASTTGAKGYKADLDDLQMSALKRLCAQAVKLIPEHLAKNVPVIFCGGVQINTPAGKPDFFAPRHMEIYSPGEGPPNDAMAAYRANLKTLILFDTKKPGEESKDEKK
mmetsp:Transcript_15996/g.48045  ORF Transcript_15996/g.48045 Transcript_15996/m.48045 type:complete len:332 (+) Transcript_15996:355-1350(+)